MSDGMRELAEKYRAAMCDRVKAKLRRITGGTE